MKCIDCGFCQEEVISGETATWNERLITVYGVSLTGVSIRTFCKKGRFDFDTHSLRFRSSHNEWYENMYNELNRERKC